MGILLTIIIVAIIMAMYSSNNNGNHIKCDGKKYFDINTLKMDSPKAQQVFDFYKSMLLDKKLNLHEVLRDVNLRRELNKIKAIQKSLPNDNDMVFIDALDSEFCDFTASRAPDGIILNPQEECYFNTQACAVDTIQKIARNVTYGGIRTSNNGVRFGSGTIYSKDVEGLRRFDAGTLLVTNQRIIFKGTKKTKTISIGSILSVDKFDDNGVIISMSNRENPIVIRFIADKCFNYVKEHDIAFFYNNLNWFYKALETSFYKRFVPKEIQDMRKDADELNFSVARKTMIEEGLEKEVVE